MFPFSAEKKNIVCDFKAKARDDLQKSTPLGFLGSWLGKLFATQYLPSLTLDYEEHKACFFYRKELIEALKGKEANILTSDKQLINLMHFSAENNLQKNTVIFFCPNGTPYELWPSLVAFYLQNDLNVILLNYRGVGASQGKASSSRDLVMDGDSVYQYARDKLKVPERRILLHGRSIGGGVASQVASFDRRPCALVNERSFDQLSHASQWYLAYHLENKLGSNPIALMICKFCGNVSKFFTELIDWEIDSLNAWKQVRGKKWLHYVSPDETLGESSLIYALRREGFIEKEQAIFLDYGEGHDGPFMPNRGKAKEQFLKKLKQVFD